LPRAFDPKTPNVPLKDRGAQAFTVLDASREGRRDAFC